MSGLPVRKTVRASGYVALLGVLLFGSMGLYGVTADQGPKGAYEYTTVPAGTALDTETFNRAIIWGEGDSLVPDDVTCSVTRRDNGMALELDLPRGEEHPTVAVRGAHGPGAPVMTLLAEMPDLPGSDLTCSGGGLEAFALGELRLGPPLWVVGIGFFVFAGVAALWSLVTLTLTRDRDRDHAWSGT